MRCLPSAASSDPGEQADDELLIEVRPYGAHDVDVCMELHLARRPVRILELRSGCEAARHQMGLDLGQLWAWIRSLEILFERDEAALEESERSSSRPRQASDGSTQNAVRVACRTRRGTIFPFEPDALATAAFTMGVPRRRTCKRPLLRHQVVPLLCALGSPRGRSA